MAHHPFNLVCGIFMAIAVVTLAACGGGGGGSPGTPPPTPSSGAPATPTDPEPEPAPTSMRFSRIADSGLNRLFGGLLPPLSSARFFSGGVAAADYDADGDVDLYVVGGVSDPNHLYQNQGDGTFIEVAATVGLDVTQVGSGPAFGDIDGDGDLDLFVGAAEDTPVYLFENRLAAQGTFVDITFASGITLMAPNTVSATWFDYDGDGYLDLFLAHWGAKRQTGDDTETVWRNNGDGSFTNTSMETGIAAGLMEKGSSRVCKGEDCATSVTDWSFTPNFSDIDGDGDGDLLMAADYGTSQVLVNNGDATFTRVTDRDVIIDQEGMGASVGDYDNDGDMDWFVTSIYNLDVDAGESFGNRLYRNHGSAVFEDVTLAVGVDNGEWGWASCAADFDNDGHLDIFHVNGWNDDLGKDFTEDPVRFFHSQGDGTFAERAEDVGLDDTGQGRGVACFDAERDGDIDIVITNNDDDHLVYYRNETTSDNHYLGIRLAGPGANRFGVGAHITVTTNDGAQVRELRAGNNFASHNPLEVHFGLGAATVADVVVRWPDGTETSMNDVDVDQLMTITY